MTEKVTTTDQTKKEGKGGIKALVKTLIEQVNLDETLRNQKAWLNIQSAPQKWEELEQELTVRGVKLSQSELQHHFVLKETENNPFFSVS